MTLVDGWQFDAIGEIDECFEIEMSKESANACFRLVNPGSQDLSSAFDILHFNLLESLFALGCEIDPALDSAKSLITARHPDKAGTIFNYLKKTSPIIHFSAASVTSSEQIQELMFMADSTFVDDTKLLSITADFGALVPMTLNEEFWTKSQ